MSRDAASISARMRWAIRHSGRNQADLADAMGVSRPVLTQWLHSDETIANAKVRNVMAFCAATGVNLQWLMTGEGPAISSYVRAHPLIVEAEHIVQDVPSLAETGYRLLKALESSGAN